MQPPQQAKAKLENKIIHNERFVEYHFELTQPYHLPFLAGQYVSIKVDENGARRSYSVCHRPDIQHGFELLIDHQPAGVGTTYLASLEYGQEIELVAPLGRFILKEHQPNDQLFFVATGSGITPFKAMIEDLLQLQQMQNHIELHWGMRYARDLFWLDEWSQVDDAFQNFHFLPVLSEAIPEWTLSTGRVTDVFRLKEFNSTQSAHVYLCGSDAMISDMIDVLETRGVPSDQIYHEKFY